MPRQAWIRPLSSAAPTATTPVRRTRLNSKDSGTPRRRLNSREIHLAASAVTSENDNWETNMYAPGFPSSNGAYHFNTLGWSLVYLTVLGLLQILSVALVGPVYSTTLTNLLHSVLTILSLHWIKGQPFDDTGRHAGWTLWEQLLVAGEQEETALGHGSATDLSEKSKNHNKRFCLNNGRRALQSWLLLVPTFLTYAACVQCNYEPKACVLNLVSWLVVLVAKLPAMKGVRLFGINRTVGIDDDFVVDKAFVVKEKLVGPDL